MQRLYKNWNGRGIEDDGAYTSKEYNSFYRQFVNAVKRSFPDAKVTAYKGHYHLFGFIEKEGKVIYFSHDVPRGGFPVDLNRRDAMCGILYRSAKDTKDFSGGTNHFTNALYFKEDVERLFQFMQRR